MWEKIKTFDNIFLIFLITFALAIIGVLSIRFGFHDYEQREVNFSEDKKVNYKVYLKENDFFQEEFLPGNMTYINNLIDYINIDFNYNIEFTDKLSGVYNYYIKGIVEANQVDSDSKYYTKEYILSEVKTKKYDNKNSFKINEKIDIDYQKYNALLTDFKEEYGVSMDGNLQIVLTVQNMVKDNKLDENITKNSKLNLNIPLTSLTLEVPIETNTETSEGVLFSGKIVKEGFLYFVGKIIAIICYTGAIILLLYAFYLIYLSVKKESIYQKQLRKILKVYDGIIVNLKKRPILTKSKVIPVATFEELIDAHSEVRNPINYIAEKEGALFLLMSDNIVYSYHLKRELFKRKENVKDEEVYD